MSTPLASSFDVVARLGRDLTESEMARIDALLADASGAVRNYTRQELIAVANDVVRVKVRNGFARLPQRPVTAVDSVVNVNGDPVIYQWTGSDTIDTIPNVPDTFAWVPFINGVVMVAVTYDHGYNPIPDDIIGVVCSMAMRALGRDPIDSGMTSESIAGYSYSLGAAAASGALGMLQAERDILDTYARRDGQIQVAAIR